MSASERGLAHHIKAEYVIYVPQQQPEQPFIKNVRHCVPLLPFPHLALIYSTESTQPPQLLMLLLGQTHLPKSINVLYGWSSKD